MIIYYALKSQQIVHEWISENWLTYTGFGIGILIAHLILR